MSTSVTSGIFAPAPDTRQRLIKWIVALLVPVVVFTIWGGETIINTVISPGTASGDVPRDTGTLIQAGIFIVIFYAAIIALAGYLVAADSGRRGMVELWLDILVFALVPLLLIIVFGLVIGIAVCVVVWAVYFLIRGRLRKALHYTPPVPLASLKVLDAEGRILLIDRAIAGGFWFATLFALVSLIV
ncbi:MAG TPA: hypothetical protein VKP04_06340, partial [Ktedonobacteraceae bacterium]|nr:hypothetical protein [Ktedonobacteraceae bacterium]